MLHAITMNDTRQSYVDDTRLTDVGDMALFHLSDGSYLIAEILAFIPTAYNSETDTLEDFDVLIQHMDGTPELYAVGELEPFLIGPVWEVLS